jgi:ATP-dependent DNA ligase
VLPSSLAPQLCTLVSGIADVPSGDKWLLEIKYDGWRLLARNLGGHPKPAINGHLKTGHYG